MNGTEISGRSVKCQCRNKAAALLDTPAPHLQPLVTLRSKMYRVACHLGRDNAQFLCKRTATCLSATDDCKNKPRKQAQSHNHRGYTTDSMASTQS
ncbi:hypothetical protein J6590_002445 [Homalodisca vitripennis]|nr:hypothetical protein J6590_002445 [Homalodisca vitripennis]